jgi:uncharacterized protein (DUF1810 family)
MNTLDRFVQAQASVHDQALAELKAGRKTGHWMWFVLPQLRGLGRSSTAQHYGIADRTEAEAYLAHPLLGERLRQCVQATLAHRGRSPERILGEVDALKFRSCLTLFDAVSATPANVFRDALEAFYGGRPDEATLDLLH